jgi:hypothetical protein
MGRPRKKSGTWINTQNFYQNTRPARSRRDRGPPGGPRRTRTDDTFQKCPGDDGILPLSFLTKCINIECISRVAQFFARLRPVCRYSFDTHDLGRRNRHRRGTCRIGANRVEPHQSSASPLVTYLPTNILRAAGPFRRSRDRYFGWSANALGMQGECGSDALGTSHECARFGPEWPFPCPTRAHSGISAFLAGGAMLHESTRFGRTASTTAQQRRGSPRG